MWYPKSFLSGHFESVNDLVWSPDSQYLVTVSSDQTCRLHASILSGPSASIYNDNSCDKVPRSDSVLTRKVIPMTTVMNNSNDVNSNNNNNDNNNNNNNSGVSRNRNDDNYYGNDENSNMNKLKNKNDKLMDLGPWREISRPQIHGYVLHSIAIAPSSSSYLLYSAADEKLLRVFDAPLSVIDGLSTLCGIHRSPQSIDRNALSNKIILHESNTDINENQQCESTNRVRRAYIPELGLSNRAAETMSSQEKYEQDARNVQGLDWSHAPLEGQLADYTVWPGESESVYSLWLCLCICQCLCICMCLVHV